jgi:hypothetical protein
MSYGVFRISGRRGKGRDYVLIALIEEGVTCTDASFESGVLYLEEAMQLSDENLSSLPPVNLAAIIENSILDEGFSLAGINNPHIDAVASSDFVEAVLI